MSRPTLWHIPISHYSEKVRGALAYKDVEHRRQAPPPGAHIPLALVLTRGRTATLPVLAFDGRRVGDSTAIIAALEERHPEPPLYPADPGERRRALALEDTSTSRSAPRSGSTRSTPSARIPSASSAWPWPAHRRR